MSDRIYGPAERERINTESLMRIAEALERIAEAEEKRTRAMTEPITWGNLERFEHG